MINLSQEAIDLLLEKSLIGRLSMVDDQAKPYTIPLPFCWHGGSIYVRLAMTGRKGDILRVNRQVCFEVDWFTMQLDDYASVIIEGCLNPVEDMEEKAAIRLINDDKYRRLRPEHRPGHGRVTLLKDLPMRKIVVERLGGRRMSPRPYAPRKNPLEMTCRANGCQESLAEVQHNCSQSVY